MEPVIGAGCAPRAPVVAHQHLQQLGQRSPACPIATMLREQRERGRLAGGIGRRRATEDLLRVRDRARQPQTFQLAAAGATARDLERDRGDHQRTEARAEAVLVHSRDAHGAMIQRAVAPRDVVVR